MVCKQIRLFMKYLSKVSLRNFVMSGRKLLEQYSGYVAWRSGYNLWDLQMCKEYGNRTMDGSV
jgi:hypothetical protein